VLMAVVAYHGWRAEEFSTRIVGHDAQAIWTPAYTHEANRWGTLGRKVDPTGTRPDKQPIIDVAAVRKGLSS